MNLSYQLTDVLDFDFDDCTPTLDTTLIFGLNGLETQFVYTQRFIEQTLLSDLERASEIVFSEYLQDTSQTALLDSVAALRAQIDVWESVLTQNAEAKENARLVDNISFNAGSIIERSQRTDTINSYNLEFLLKLNSGVSLQTYGDLKVNAGIPGGGSELTLGTRLTASGHISMGMQIGRTQVLTQQNSTEVGFTLADDDLDGQSDFFSVDISEDPIFGTLAFPLRGGSTSCPYEPGTQARYEPSLRVEAPVLTDVAGAAADFRFFLGNISQSEEVREYEVALLEEFNVDGATVSISGQERTSVSLSVAPGNELPFVVSVTRPSTSCAVSGLPFVVRPACADFAEGDNAALTDTVFISAYFTCDCGGLSFKLPEENWLVNASSGDFLQIQFTQSRNGASYLPERIRQVQLQYAESGTSNWREGTRWEGDQLPADPEDFIDNWALPAELPDGDYQIRLLIFCADEGRYTYSEILQGRVDRVAPVLAGLPEPFDRLFETGDRLAARFSETLNCDDLTAAQLVAPDGTVVDPLVAPQCLEADRIVFRPSVNLQDFRGDTLSLTFSGVEDLAENRNDNLLRWTFTIADSLEAVVGVADFDLDGIPDQEDNCPTLANPGQEDGNGNGIGTLCDSTETIVSLLPERAVGVMPLQVRPVPAQAYVEVLVPELSVQLVELALYDLRGRLLKRWRKQHPGRDWLKLNIAELPAGMYVLRANGGQRVFTSRLIKN